MSSSSSANLLSKQQPRETQRCQSRRDVERQRFFEEVFQHDVDVFLSSAHLGIRGYHRPPLDSISSMEVNVDLLDQMEPFDLPDQEGLDVFFSSGGEEGPPTPTPPLTAQMNRNTSEEETNSGLFQHVLQRLDNKKRLTSTSSDSSCDIQTTGGANGGVGHAFGSD